MHKNLRLLLAVLATVMALPATAHAAFSFTRTDVAVPAGPASLAIADVDGKNGPDIVATLYKPTDAKIAVLLNKGDGTFAGPTYYAACDGAYDTEIGDVTTTGNDLAQDGKLDVATACFPDVGRAPCREVRG